MNPKKITQLYLASLAGLILFFTIFPIKKSQEKITGIKDHILCKNLSNEKKLLNFLQSFKANRYEKFQAFDTPFSYDYLNSSINEDKITNFFSRNPNLLGANSETKLQYHLKILLSNHAPIKHNESHIDLNGYSIIYNELGPEPIVIIPISSIKLKNAFSERLSYKINSDLGTPPHYTLTTQKIKSRITNCGNYVEDLPYNIEKTSRLK